MLSSIAFTTLFSFICSLTPVPKAITIEELLGQPEISAIKHEAPVPGEKYIPVLDLDGPVMSNTVDPLIAEIKLDNDDNAEKIVLRINSPGGSVFDGLRLATAIEQSKAPVVCVVDMGMAASMAAYILQSCQERVVSKRSLLMFHSPAGGTEGQPEHIKQFLKEMEALNDAMIEQYAHRTNLSAKEWHARIDHDQAWWITWRTAKKYGIADTVIVSGVDFIKKLKSGPPSKKALAAETMIQIVAMPLPE